MADWGDIFRKHVRAGEDHGAAAFAADEWEKRMQRKKKCEWKQDEDDGSWDTACGEKFCIEEGNPEDNGMRFCCYCGATLETPNVKVQGQDEAQLRTVPLERPVGRKEE